jgi:hypothetical protein
MFAVNFIDLSSTRVDTKHVDVHEHGDRSSELFTIGMSDDVAVSVSSMNLEHGCSRC